MSEIISTFRQKPKLATTWRAMHLGLASLLVPPFLGIFAAVIRPLLDRASVNGDRIGIPLGFGAVAAALILSVSAIVVSYQAFRRGERSWVLWSGFIPAILIGAFWIIMIVGEIVFPH